VRDAAAVVITVADTGRGLPSGAEAPRGYGVEHVRDRLRAFYGPAATLTLAANEPAGARAIVRVAT
jgi:LytS/YehU family sensor histidine kinase